MSISGGPDESARTLPRWKLTARPFGYLVVGLVWLAITGIALFLWFVLPGALGSSGALSDSAGVRELSDPVQLLAFLVFAVIGSVLIGWAFLSLPIAALSLAVLSFLFVGRSLSPRYATEPLSRTGLSTSAIGPPFLALMPKAVSLMPVRQTRASAAISTVMLMTIMPSFRTIVSCFWVGLAYLFSLTWLLWPVTSPTLVTIFSIVTVVVTLFGVWRIARAVRRRYVELNARVVGDPGKVVTG